MEGGARRFRAEADFEEDPRQRMRRAVIEPELTNAYRLIHGGADGWPGWYVDRFGDYLLSQAATSMQPAWEEWMRRRGGRVGDARGLPQDLIAQDSGRHARTGITGSVVW